MKRIAFFILLALAASLRAEVSLAPLFRDGAVLQRDRPLPVWGHAGAGETVKVSFGDAGATAAATATADAQGRWSVVLPKRPASATPRDLVVEGRNRVVVRDVLVGDVWLCAGQSNMQMTAGNALDAARETAAANYPTIRQFKVANQFSPTPQDNVGGEWRACSPQTFAAFTAVGIFFARAIQRELGVPIGLVNCTYGNTSISSWRSEPALARQPEVAAWWQQQLRAKTPPRPHRRPSVCYDGMVYPLEPYALRGCLWYQGESDATELAFAPIYDRQFPALIAEWRQDFHQPELPFFWVQLAGYGEAGDRAWVTVRAAQEAALKLPHTGQASAIDVGDAHDIHFKNKQAVGDRLARLALHRVYGREIADTGPEVAAVTREGDQVTVRFTHAAGGLSERGKLAAAFELADADGKFSGATDVRVDGEAVIVRAAPITRPTAVRFSWQALPVGGLSNRDGLPAVPFVRELPKS